MEHNVGGGLVGNQRPAARRLNAGVKSLFDNQRAGTAGPLLGCFSHDHTAKPYDEYEQRRKLVSVKFSCHLTVSETTLQAA
jgi:hypothetical protein